MIILIYLFARAIVILLIFAGVTLFALVWIGVKLIVIVISALIGEPESPEPQAKFSDRR